MHYGGSTLDAMTPAQRQVAHMVNDLERLRVVRGGLTPYQQSVRFWAYSKLRLANYLEGKEEHHA